MITFVRWLGRVALIVARTIRALPRLHLGELARSLVVFGAASLPLTITISALGGALVIVQTRLYAERFGARTLLGWAGAYAIFWEFGPLLLGLTLAARIGSRNAAELAAMTVRGDIEGLRGVAIDPYRLLVAPRVVAMWLASVLLALVSFPLSIAVEAAAARATLSIPAEVFLSSMTARSSFADVIAGLAKTSAYAIAIAFVSTGAGFSAAGGSRAVGRAAARAVVQGAACVFALDFLLTPLLARWLS